MKTNLLFATLAFALVSLAGCSSGDHDGSSNEQGALQEQNNPAPSEPQAVRPGTFKMYDAPNAVADECDAFLSLTLSADRKARLHTASNAGCDLEVDPQTRGYDLKVSDDGCGSKIYKGERTEGGRVISLVITDNRERVCENPIAALVELVESGYDAGEIKVYSKDR